LVRQEEIQTKPLTMSGNILDKHIRIHVLSEEKKMLLTVIENHENLSNEDMTAYLQETMTGIDNEIETLQNA
jgi:hypothetical protein